MKKIHGGFTFVELMVVMAITGIIFAISIVTYTNVTRGSRDARRKADLESIRQALELHRSYCGSYPAAVVGDGKIECGTPLQTYMTKVPMDPKTDISYDYDLTATGYTLTATLENPEGPYTVTNP